MWKERLLTLLRDNALPAVKRRWLPLTFALVGLVLILVGIASTVITENQSKGVIIEEAASSDRSSEFDKTIIVDVSGAVVKPGVYKISGESRIQETLIAAGGLAENADREYVSKNINLALKISDGAKIYIPKIGESITRSTSSGQAGIKGSGEVAGSVTGLVNINTASQSELELLPGIGPVTAQKIIDSRPYRNVDDLLEKKVAGQKVFEKIREKITIY